MCNLDSQIEKPFCFTVIPIYDVVSFINEPIGETLNRCRQKVAEVTASADGWYVVTRGWIDGPHGWTKAELDMSKQQLE